MENKVNVNDIDSRFNCFKANMLYLSKHACDLIYLHIYM